MDKRILHVAEYLLLIERELRALHWWSAESPTPEQLASTAPFCVDTLSLQAWLQWVFLAKMKIIIEHGLALPHACAIQPMAAVAWAEEGTKVAGLLALLAKLDAVLSQP